RGVLTRTGEIRPGPRVSAPGGEGRRDDGLPASGHAVAARDLAMTGGSADTAVMTDLSHPIFARLYPRLDAASARAGGDALRAELLAGTSGRVLEVGAGYGANFAHYPPEVTEVVAVEPEPRLRAKAEGMAARAPVPVTVRPGLAEELDLDDGSFDVAVASLVLCSVRDPV